ncbi:hypothetical protein C5167_021340 [Papaver somniferum]|uniref:Uncharacterized protein n=1 Tax=Papaver somniferum TaxID=3469 RepID=A0A4Y7IVM2_PAPSO|nr:hypothetical protein C5167_021340 [Papaver somniferum]
MAISRKGNRVDTKLERKVSVDIKMKCLEEVQVDDLENEEYTEYVLANLRTLKMLEFPRKLSWLNVDLFMPKFPSSVLKVEVSNY